MERAIAPRFTRWLLVLTVLGVVFLGGVLLGFALFMWKSSPMLSREGMMQVTRDGDEIVGAVLRFLKEHGDMPRSIDQLVPAHLDTVPWSVFGQWELVLTDSRRPPGSAFAVKLKVQDRLTRVRSNTDSISCYHKLGEASWWYREHWYMGDTDLTRLRIAKPSGVERLGWK